MSKHNNIKSFSADDIERYHHGLVTAAERNALEKAALEDPFLADALEGFMTMPVDKASDMKELKDRLRKRLDEKNKIIPIAPGKSKRYYFQIAAMVLLMAGAGWFFYQYSQHRKTEAPIALNDRNNNPVMDTTISANPPAATPVEKSDLFLHTDTANKKTKIIQKPTSNGLQQQKSLARETNFGTYQPDSNFIGEVNPAKEKAAKDEAKMMMIASEHQKTLPVSADMESADSIVVSGMGVKKDAARSAKGRSNISDPVSIPLIGWAAYQQYLKDSLQAPPGFTKAGSGQFVELSFDVNANGQPNNYNIISTFSKSAAEEAWRLVSKGPLWTPGKGKLKIYF